MPKVLYLIDTLEVGGAETSILEIASRLDTWIPVVVSIYKGNTLKPKFEASGIKVYALNIEGSFNFMNALKKINSVIQSEDPDLIHATLFRAEQFSRILGKRNNVPVLNSFVNDSYSSERFESISFKQKLALNLYKFVDRITAKRVDSFMSITRAIVPNNAKALGINKESVEVIYRGRDINKLRSNASIQFKEIEDFGGRPVILTVSRLLKRKGYVEAFQSIAKVVKKYPDLIYLVAGEGHDRKIFEALINSLKLHKNIKLLGNRPDVPGLLKKSDIFLFPSHYEGQGGALVEAMIMGKPIIASKIPVIEESVTDGHSAILFKKKNIEDMASKIIWALDNMDKMNILGQTASNVASEKFEISKVVQFHEILYKKIICN